jgi:D-serine deaminase-like pyridoxal phosphate-dependent protein
MQRNIARMQARMTPGRALPPAREDHQVRRGGRAAQRAAGAQGITVSTLKEAEQFFAAGITDILYAVGIVPHQAAAGAGAAPRGCDLKLITDNVDAAQAIAASAASTARPSRCGSRSTRRPPLGHPAGSDTCCSTWPRAGRRRHALGGVMTHAGSSYDLDQPEALAAMAEQERAGCVRAAERLRAAGLPARWSAWAPRPRRCRRARCPA